LMAHVFAQNVSHVQFDPWNGSASGWACMPSASGGHRNTHKKNKRCLPELARMKRNTGGKQRRRLRGLTASMLCHHHNRQCLQHNKGKEGPHDTVLVGYGGADDD